MFILFKFVFAAALIFHSSGAMAEQPQTDPDKSANAKTDNLPDGAVKLPSGLIVPPRGKTAAIRFTSAGK